MDTNFRKKRRPRIARALPLPKFGPAKRANECHRKDVLLDFAKLLECDTSSCRFGLGGATEKRCEDAPHSQSNCVRNSSSTCVHERHPRAENLRQLSRLLSSPCIVTRWNPSILRSEKDHVRRLRSFTFPGGEKSISSTAAASTACRCPLLSHTAMSPSTGGTCINSGCRTTKWRPLDNRSANALKGDASWCSRISSSVMRSF
jgi:hypothetical protein